MRWQFLEFPVKPQTDVGMYITWCPGKHRGYPFPGVSIQAVIHPWHFLTSSGGCQKVVMSLSVLINTDITVIWFRLIPLENLLIWIEFVSFVLIKGLHQWSFSSVVYFTLIFFFYDDGDDITIITAVMLLVIIVVVAVVVDIVIAIVIMIYNLPSSCFVLFIIMSQFKR